MGIFEKTFEEQERSKKFNILPIDLFGRLFPSSSVRLLDLLNMSHLLEINA